MTTLKNVTFTVKQLTVSLIKNYPVAVLFAFFALLILPGFSAFIG
jgi:hypothetical protein